MGDGKVTNGGEAGYIDNNLTIGYYISPIWEYIYVVISYCIGKCT